VALRVVKEVAMIRRSTCLLLMVLWLLIVVGLLLGVAAVAP
jgi:hypothetical protein